MVTRRTLLRIVFPGVPTVMVERYEAADSARPLHCVTYGQRIADGLGREDATRETIDCINHARQLSDAQAPVTSRFVRLVTETLA